MSLLYTMTPVAVPTQENNDDAKSKSVICWYSFINNEGNFELQNPWNCKGSRAREKSKKIPLDLLISLKSCLFVSSLFWWSQVDTSTPKKLNHIYLKSDFELVFCLLLRRQMISQSLWLLIAIGSYYVDDCPAGL